MATISPATLDIGANGQYKAAQGTITVSKPAINTTATLNDAAVTFTHWLANVTDTASAAASLLVDLQVGGSSKFKVTKAGAGTFAAGVTATTGTFSGAVSMTALSATTGAFSGAAAFSSTVAVASTISVANAVITGGRYIDLKGSTSVAASDAQLTITSGSGLNRGGLYGDATTLSVITGGGAGAIAITQATGAVTLSSTLAVTGTVTGGNIHTATATNSTATGTTWTTAFGLSASRVYRVEVASDTSGQDQSAIAVYHLDTAGNVRIRSLAATAGTALSASGTTITVVNTSGVTQNYLLTLTRIY